MYHCNTSPAAVTAHIDYETKMILFIVDSGAGNTETNKIYSTLLAQREETGDLSKLGEGFSHLTIQILQVLDQHN